LDRAEHSEKAMLTCHLVKQQLKRLLREQLTTHSDTSAIDLLALR